MNMFIDGPTTCENHNWKGSTIYYTASGKRITPYTFMKWISFTSAFRSRLIYQHQEKIDDPITSATSSCSNCKQELNPFWDIPGF